VGYKLKHIKLVGIELEGAWHEIDYYKSIGFKHDGSVSIEKNEKRKYIGEIVSDPLTLDKLLRWIDDNYPDYTNRSCGGHIHFSFNSLEDYAKLEDRKFFYFMLQELEKWGKDNRLNEKSVFWERVYGKNKYCKKEFCPEEQVKDQGGSYHRYTMINACYHKHGTLEIRVLPCFQKKRIMLKAVKFMYELVENYLENNKCGIEIKKSLKLSDCIKKRGVGLSV
jgi:hypothetical protein